MLYLSSLSLLFFFKQNWNAFLCLITALTIISVIPLPSRNVYFYLSIWLCWVLDAVFRLASCAMQTFSWSHGV